MQSEHRGCVLGGPFVRLEGQGDALRGRGVAQPAEVGDDRLALGVVLRLARAGDADLDSEPPRREADPPLGQLHAFGGTDVGPADIAAADLDAMPREMFDERPGRVVVGPLGDHRRFGDDQPAEVVPAKRQLEMVDPRLADSLDGRPDPRCAVAVREAAQTFVASPQGSSRGG